MCFPFFFFRLSREQHQSSNDVKVMLKRLNLKSSGMYRCEVSAEAPSFSSVEDEGRMEVVCKCANVNDNNNYCFNEIYISKSKRRKQVIVTRGFLLSIP